MAVGDRTPYPEIARDRIRSTLLIEKLQNHVLEGTPMTRTQVQAANILLRKTVPDQSNIANTHSAPDGGPVRLLGITGDIPTHRETE